MLSTLCLCNLCLVHHLSCAPEESICSLCPCQVHVEWALAVAIVSRNLKSSLQLMAWPSVVHQNYASPAVYTYLQLGSHMLATLALIRDRVSESHFATVWLYCMRQLGNFDAIGYCVHGKARPAQMLKRGTCLWTVLHGDCSA